MRRPEEHNEGDILLRRWSMLTAALLLSLVPLTVGVWLLVAAQSRGILPIALILFGPMVVVSALLALSLLSERWPLIWRPDDPDE